MTSHPLSTRMKIAIGAIFALTVAIFVGTLNVNPQKKLRHG